MFGGSGKLPSNMNHTFSNVPAANIPRSAFDRSHGWRGTINASYLVPILVDEALPGDTFSCRLSSFGRLATPIKPFMDNLWMDFFFFAVPYRLVWDHWEKFNGAQDNPGDSTSYLIPTATSGTAGYPANSLQDYMGLPTAGQVGSGNTVTHNNLHPRAYNLIWNEWFRDENLQNSVEVDTGDGPDTWTEYALLKAGKRHDYFTSCLPWPQKGTAVTVPLGTSAPVVLSSTTGIEQIVRHASDHTIIHVTGLQSDATSGSLQSSGATDVNIDPNGSLVANLSGATAATINQLRQSFQIQRLYERDARGGTRYTEIVRSHFGVISPDARLQRPEYLGGGRTAINLYPVAQTSQSPGSPSITDTPQGNLAAMGVHSQSGVGFVKSFTEHCLIIGLACIRADISYQQGMNRMWSRQTRWDYYWPALSHIGEQAVLNQEIYCDGSGPSGNDGGVFGYQERYAEYRYKPSVITGEFKSTYAQPLDFWHLSEDFLTLPALNNSFIQDKTSIVLERVSAVESEPQMYLDCYFNYKCARPMPTYGVPGLIDHF